MTTKVIASAPLLSAARVKGGTLYTFSSTVNDFSYLFDESDTKIVPSKFIALKLPRWVDAASQSMFIDPASVGSPTNDDPNYMFAKCLQDYFENYIQYSEANRTDGKTFLNTSEQAFWKFMQYLGALTLEDSGEQVVHDSTAKNVYREKATQAGYEQLIKFTGEINLANHVKEDGVEYMEYFMHIPTDAGAASNINFIRSSLEHNASAIPVDGGADITYGLDEYDGTDSVSALYDDDVANTYSVDQDIDRMNVMLADSFSDSDKRDNGDFEFNAILLYYDMYSGANPEARQTNAYGIMLLDPFTTLTAGSGEIRSFQKLQPDATQPGNAYSFRLNLKFSNTTNQITSEIAINDYSTVSMELYMNALRQLKTVSEQYAKMSIDMVSIKTTMNQLEQTILNSSKIISAAEQIAEHEQMLQQIIGSTVGVNNDRITTDELLQLFLTMSNNMTSSDKVINNEIVVSSRAFLPTVLDPSTYLIEANDGSRYQYNLDTEQWDLIEE